MFTRTFERRVRTAVAVLALAGVVGVSFGAYVLWPSRREAGYMPDQPIPYSHKLHAGELRIDCLYCHVAAEKGPQATVPSLSICMNCHSQVQTRDAQGRLSTGIALLLDHKQQRQPIIWNKVHDLADFVYFDHSRHMTAGMKCQECHGPVETMEHMYRVYGMKMSWCLDCHKQKPTEQTGAAKKGLRTRAPIHCTTCHR